MKPSRLLMLLLAFLRPAIEGDQAQEPDEPQLDLGDDPPPDDPDADDAPPDDPAAQLAAERAARAAEREESERDKRELAELRANQTRPAPLPDATEAEEERRLNDASVPDLEKWQIRANREIRAQSRNSQQALAQAQDIADKTGFSQVAIKSPALFKRYESRVEEELQKLRARGQNAPREAILRFLIGNDALDGKLTSKKPAAAKTTAPANGTVNRGKLPGARSDVGGRGAATEHEKRRARLEGVQI